MLQCHANITFKIDCNFTEWKSDPGTHCSAVWPLWDEALTAEIKTQYGITGIGECG
jgi:hypothetical protein